MSRTAIIIATVFALSCAACGGGTIDVREPDASAMTGSTDRVTPAAPEPSCVASPASKTDEHDAYVYRYCIDDLQPLPVDISEGADPVVTLVHAYAAGPTRSQKDLGYHGGLQSGTKFDVYQTATAINVDLDAESFSVELFNANMAFPVVQPLVRMLREYTGVGTVTLTIDGKSLCSMNEECSMDRPTGGRRVSIMSHCGVVSAWVQDALWLADLPVGDHNPPAGWGENETPGYFVVTGPGRATFHGDGGQVAGFRLAAPGTPDPMAGCE